jgi:hypothetical protein
VAAPIVPIKAYLQPKIVVGLEGGEYGFSRAPPGGTVNEFVRRNVKYYRAPSTASSRKAPRPNHHHRRASGANDDGGASARTRTDYHSSSSGDSSADSSHRSIQDKGRNRPGPPICQSNRQPSISGARKRRAQAPTELGENIFS